MQLQLSISLHYSYACMKHLSSMQHFAHHGLRQAYTKLFCMPDEARDGRNVALMTNVSWCARSSKEGSSCNQLSMPINFHEILKSTLLYGAIYTMQLQLSISLHYSYACMHQLYYNMPPHHQLCAHILYYRCRHCYHV